MTDFRALCAELVEAWDDLPWEWESDFKGTVAGIHSDLYNDVAVARARAALAEPMSPSAEAVLDAFFASGWEDEPLHANIAAALRTAADQLYDSASQDYLWKLAAELENTND